MPRAKAYSSMLFTGAKPVEPATKIIGLSESSRRKNEPRGPSKRTRSPGRMRSNTCAGEAPALDAPDVQFDVLRDARRGGEGEAALGAVLEQRC